MTGSGTKLLLVGCGTMGGALVRGVLAARLVSELAVVEPAPCPENLKPVKNLVWRNTLDGLSPSFVPDLVFVAVKPQVVAAVLPPYAQYANAVFLSIVAGTTMAKFSALLGNPSAAIVRTMPNLPASIGQGATVAIANRHVTSPQRALCDRFLKAIGETAWVEDEALLDVVTALSGSGPAYVFALCEAMARAGESMGLPKEMAEQLARQTIIGSGALLAASPESASELRRAVTSPKGTTEAALEHLMAEGGLNEVMKKTMEAAAARAKELAQ